MSRLFAVGDIHGCAQTLAELLDRIGLAAGDRVITIGDLSSKGWDSKSVHQQLVELRDRDVQVIPLLGNHEVMLLAMQRLVGASICLDAFPDSLFQDAEIEFLMRQNGTWATLKSYGFEGVNDEALWAFGRVDPRIHFTRVRERIADMPWQLPADHLALLATCRTHHIERNCLFVHAGLHPEHLQAVAAEVAIEAQLGQRARDICWNREGLYIEPGFPELLVHGHTPLPYLYSRVPSTDPWKDEELLFKSVVHAGALNLDSGAFMESGHLTAVEIPADGNLDELRFIRVPRIDPVERDRLWYLNHM